MFKPVIKIFSILALVISAFFAEKYYSKNKTELSDVEHIISSQQSGQIVSLEGEVIKLLKDDLEGSKHQKLIIKTGNHTLLLVHNIDIAPRVPVTKGDKLIFKGEYEWNNQGGLVHWTHRSTSNHPGGWIKHKNIKYQ